jgi:hypothetical protein
MSRWRRLAIATGAWLVCGGAGGTALDTLDACAARATAEARGIVALEAQCPGLEPALGELGLVEVLPDGWRDRLQRDQLGDLASLTHRYLDAPARVAPDAAALRAVLDQLAREQVRPPRSWRAAFMDWLRSWFANRDEGSGRWFERVLERLAQSIDLVKVVTYGLLGLVVVAAVVLVVRELRAAGLLSGRGNSAPRRDAAAMAPTDAATPDILDLDAVALRDQPAVLLRLLVARLLANGQLRAERSLTHRELATHSTFSDAESRTLFVRVTQLAERVLYGSGEANATQAGAVIADGRKLLLRLQAPEVARP